MAIFTWVFGAGAWLVIFFLFLPLLDLANVKNRNAAITEGELNLLRKREEARLKEVEKDPKAAAKAEEERAKQEAKERKEWDREKVKLQARVDAAEIKVQKARYWYTWGMLFGFLVLAVGALGFLHPSQTTARRVVGGIVLAAEVLVIFVYFLFNARFG